MFLIERSKGYVFTSVVMMIYLFDYFAYKRIMFTNHCEIIITIFTFHNCKASLMVIAFGEGIFIVKCEYDFQM